MYKREMGDLVEELGKKLRVKSKWSHTFIAWSAADHKGPQKDKGEGDYDTPDMNNIIKIVEEIEDRKELIDKVRQIFFHRKIKIRLLGT